MRTSRNLAFVAATLLVAAPAAQAKERKVIENEQPPVEFLHGFRVGYAYYNNVSMLKSPHLLVMGYEGTQRIHGGDWLNVITVQNFSVTGLEQSLIIPTVNLLVGFEANERLQMGVG